MVYFSDRELGERTRNEEDIGEVPWGGLRVLVKAKIDDGSFGIDYPESCDDDLGPTGTNQGGFYAAMRAEIPSLEEAPWQAPWASRPPTIDILDMLEFCWRHVADPTQWGFHDFFGHYHLAYDRDLGRYNFREQVNLILARNGLSYALNDGEKIERLGPIVLREELAGIVFNSGNDELDRLLSTSKTKFFDPRLEVRREAVLELWDAWERLKTTGEGPNKKDQISALLDDAAGTGYPKFRERLETEAVELTGIGNNHQIRHTEIGQEKVEQSQHLDYLFHRLFSMIQLILRTKTT